MTSLKIVSSVKYYCILNWRMIKGLMDSRIFVERKKQFCKKLGN